MCRRGSFIYEGLRWKGKKAMAEADKNRTCQAKILGLTGFEDRGAHQDTYASTP